MSSGRTRKNSRGSNSRSRTRRQLDPLASIFVPPPKKGILAPIKSAERLAKKAAELINAGSELPEPTSAQKRKQKILERVKERKKQKKQRKLIPKPPPQKRRNVQEIAARKQRIKNRLKNKLNKTQKSRPGRKRTIVPKPPSKSQSKTQKSRPTARTTRKIPQRPSQKKSQGTRPTKSFVTEGNRRTSKRLKDKRLKEKKKRNFLDKIKTTLKTQINNMDEPFKAAKGRTRNPPNRLTYTK